MHLNKKAFSFVELIIVISIIALLSVIAFTVFNSNSHKANNTKIEADIMTLTNAFLSYNQETQTFPEPDWNLNFFKWDSRFGHSWDLNNFWVFGSVTQNTLPKRYLNTLPLDPVTNHFYSYWKTLNNEYFEIASIIRTTETNSTKLHWTYPWQFGPISLIREFNWPIFVSNKSKQHLPYNPNDHTLTARDQYWTIYHSWDKIDNSTRALTLYFSDGSISELAIGSTLHFSDLEFKNPENNLLTKVRLFLSSWEIITKATSLNTGSEFQIHTPDTTAAVRWTLFSVSYDTINNKTTVSVAKWTVEIQEKTNTINNLIPINWVWFAISKWEKNTSFTSTWAINTRKKQQIQDFSNFIYEENLPKWNECKAKNWLKVWAECYELYAKAEYNKTYWKNKIL